MELPKTEMRPAWRNYLPAMILAAFFLLAGMGHSAGDAETPNFNLFIALVIIALIVIRRFSWKFNIDDRRVTRHYGIIARNQQSVKIQDLRSVEMDQSVLQRILGTGTLKFYSAASAGSEVTFPGIKGPTAWRDKIDDALDSQTSS